MLKHSKENTCSGTTTLIIENEEISDIMEIVQALEKTNFWIELPH